MLEPQQITELVENKKRPEYTSIIKTWKNKLGIQSVPLGDTRQSNTMLGFVLSAKEDNAEHQLSFSIEMQQIECNLTEKELNSKLDELLLSFETQVEDNFDCIETAKQTCFLKNRRGRPNKSYFPSKNMKSIQFYSGECIYDQPVIIGEINGLYGIYIQPKFQTYGFIINKKPYCKE